MKKKILKIFFLIMLMSHFVSYSAAAGKPSGHPDEASKTSAAAPPIVGLWVVWNDLTYNFDEIDQIPTDKFNAVQLSFRFPIGKLDKIKPAIERFHKRGLKVIAFINMELSVDDYNRIAAKRGDEVGHNFKPSLNADGTPVNKGSLTKGQIHISTFFDREFRGYIERKIKLIKSAGADYVTVGELGYTMGEERNFTTEALEKFRSETGTYLPTTQLGKPLRDYLDQHPEIQEKWFYWKYQELFSWLGSLGVDGVGRQIKRLKDHTLVSPVFPGGKITNATFSGFSAKDKPDKATYDAVEEEIRLLRVPARINLGHIQFAVGNTGVTTPYLEDIPNRAKFLVERLDGFIFYGSAAWRKYKDFVKYLPDLKDYRTGTKDHGSYLLEHQSFEKLLCGFMP